MKINLYDEFCTDTLRHRETARKIVDEITKKPENDSIVIDFSNIVFASRSFCHELIFDLKNRDVVFTNRNDEVKRMMELVQHRPCSQLIPA